MNSQNFRSCAINLEVHTRNLSLATAYRTLEITNLPIGLVSGKFEYCIDEKWNERQPLNYEVTRQTSLIKLRSWNKRKLSFGATDHPRDRPLLNKAYGEYGGDNINNDQCCQLKHSHPRQVQGNNDFQSSGFLGSDDSGVRKQQVKLPGQFSLLLLPNGCIRTQKYCRWDANLISRSAKGHLNGETSVKRETCREKFLDQHFDIATVLQAQIQPLSMISEEPSYVSFLVRENLPDHLEFLEGVMSFDSMGGAPNREAT
ncbi:hypothetical protein HHK36_010864 [Tetracentron sinense]|uniref:Uncharacterized protein n=1 Tax=Tetracentron sinense TaxID=13715 RepID=A0A834Z738_TETSI|nr:hypothetical protein HHK36_010864 [Tetracentron sinense]